MRERPRWRIIFKHLNRYFMVPAFRLGLGWVIVNPVVGYIMVLKTVGRKSGKVRYAPVNYAIIEGNVYCIAGWGKDTHWYANLKANPHVELLMPDSTMAGIAEEVSDPGEARRAIITVGRNAGFALVFDGLNPLTASNEQIIARNGWMPVVRIRCVGIANGPHAPSGPERSDAGHCQWRWQSLGA